MCVRCRGAQDVKDRAVFPDDLRLRMVYKEEPQEWSYGLDQEDTDPPHVKEEQEEPWISPDGEQLQGLKEADIIRFTFEPDPVKIFPDDLQLRVVYKEEPQEWSYGLDQEDTDPPHVKEEQEEPWISPDGEQLQGLKEADIIRFTFEPDPVKSEDDEEEAKCSQLHQIQPRPMERGGEGEDCGGLEAARHPERHLQPEVKPEDSFGPQTDDSDDGEGTSEHQPHFSIEENHKPKRHKTLKRSFRCSECGKTFTQNGHLIVHMRIHTRDKPFSCSECGKGFTQRGSLTTHMRIHSGEKPYGCPECGKRFGQQGNMMNHMRIHLKEKPFSCSECGRTFTQKEILTRHMRIHTGEKPFSCPQCHKRFTRRESQAKHMKIHKGEKLFSCSDKNKPERKKRAGRGADGVNCGGSDAERRLQPEVEVEIEDF